MDKKKISELEDVIAKAISKVGGKKENDLCRFLPMSSGGYMHHFTLKKMKYKEPEQLKELVEKFIIKTDRLTSVAPKQRAARGSRKRRDHYTFTRGQLERMLNIARLAGDKEMVSVLSPKKSLAAAKRDLINSVRNNRVDHDLWNSYAESVSSFDEAHAVALQK